MSRAPRHWTLPGPSAFVHEVARIARDDGVAAVVAPPHCLPEVDAALEEALSQPWLPLLNARSQEPPLVALTKAFGIDARSASAVPSIVAAEGKAAMIEGLDADSWSSWETTLRAWVSGCARRSRFGAILVAFVAPDCEAAIQVVGVKSIRWRDVIGTRDAMLWALDRVPAKLDPLLGRLAVETAVALAGWDLKEIVQLVDSFAALPRRMFEIPELADGSNRTASWPDGTMDWLDGVEYPLLAFCRRDEAMRRVWRAQTTVLFGWLETERTDYLGRHRRTLLENIGRVRATVADLEALEWAEISRYIKVSCGARDRRAELAEEARAARNALAHLEPIDFRRFARIRSLSHADRTNVV